MKRDHKETDPAMESSDSEEEELGLGQSEDIKETVEVDFTFSDPNEAQYSSLRRLVSTLVPPKHPSNPSELADTIISQVSVGTMIGVEGEPDVYGFLTALNVARYKHLGCIKSILAYLVAKCPAEHRERVTQVLHSQKSGLIVNRRMLNTPYQLIPVLHQALLEDIEWAKKNEVEEDARSSFHFDSFILIAQVQADSKAKGVKNPKIIDIASGIFENFEEEFLAQAAEITYVIDREGTAADRAVGKKLHDVIMVLSYAEYCKVVKHLATMFSNSMEM